MVYRLYGWVALALLIAAAESKAPEHGRRVVCYMASWGPVLAGAGRFLVSDAEKALPFCTHIVYLFANLDEREHTIIPLDKIRDFDNYGYNQTVGLKKNYPHLRVMVGLGGWVDGSVKYSNMAKDPAKRDRFIKSVVQFLSAHKLDGLDLNWQFPGERDGIPADKDNLVTLTKEMRRVFDKHGWLLSAAVSAFPQRMASGVDVKRLSQNVHFLNVLSYEYHQTWDGRVGPSAPLYAPDNFSVSDTILKYLSEGAPAYKLNMGLSAYGTSYILANARGTFKTVVGQITTGHGFRGTYNDVSGFMAYNELCMEFKSGAWETQWDEISQTPFAINSEKVVSYDNADSYEAKIKFAMSKQLGGVIFYGLEKDDFKGYCGSNSTAYPLLDSIHGALLQHSAVDYADLKILLRRFPAKYFWNGYKE